MKIFYLITKSEVGGAQTHVLQLSRYMRSLGNEVAVMAYPGGWLEQELKNISVDQPKSALIRVVKFYPNPYLTNALNPIADYRAGRVLKKALAEFKPDLVTCHSTKAGIIGRFTIRNRIPTVFTAHGWGFTEGVGLARQIPILLAEKLAAHWCEKIICVSEFDKNLALRHKIASVDKFVVIHNGVEIEAIKAGHDDKGSREAEEANITIVFVGRLAEQKDPLLLLKAFNNLPQDLKNKSQVSIIGEGPKRKELEEFIKERTSEQKVSLLGHIPREKVFEFLRKSDIFVLVSHWEGFPYTIIEAMSAGLAIIASDVGGAKEALDEHCGILVKRGDELGLTNALEQLLKNPSLIKKMGEAARKRVEQEFSLEKMLKETKQIYEQILVSLRTSPKNTPAP